MYLSMCCHWQASSEFYSCQVFIEIKFSLFFYHFLPILALLVCVPWTDFLLKILNASRLLRWSVFPELTFFLWSLNACRLLRWSVFPELTFFLWSLNACRLLRWSVFPELNFFLWSLNACRLLRWSVFPELTFFLWSLNACRILRWSVFPELTFFLWSLNACRLLRWSVFPWADFLSKSLNASRLLRWSVFHELTFFLWSLSASRLRLCVHYTCQSLKHVRRLQCEGILRLGIAPLLHIELIIQMEVASSRSGHLPTLSAAKTSELSPLVTSPFWWRSGQCRQCCSDFLLQCAGDIEADHADSMVSTLWSAPTEIVKRLILAIGEAS